MEKSDIESIIDAAAQAPSGDNAQPWRFEVAGDSIFLYNLPGRDDSPYNFKERGSLFAHGAAIENMTVVAKSRGYAVHCSLFPLADRNCIAKLAFTGENISEHSNADAIYARTTNRRPYRKEPLDADHRRAIEGVPLDQGVRLVFADDRSQIAALAKTLSVSDQLIFEDSAVHDAIFTSIRWTPEEEEAKRGLYVKTLELPPPARKLFSMLRNPSVLRFFNAFGISKFIAAQSAKNYGASSAMGAIVIPDAAEANFINAGRSFERLWLLATSLGASIQPITALVYLQGRIVAHESGSMSPAHQDAVLRAERDIRHLFGDPAGTFAMVFRIGYGDAPSARSKKSKPQVAWK